jgi:DNA-binding LacI/PurR family transcriptional regulator/signal transduction histidine kinase/CheY-like chemotaxis protein
MKHVGGSNVERNPLADEANGADLALGNKGGGRRKTIAVLIDELDHQIGGYEGLLRAALNSECARFDLNQYLVVGRAIDSSEPKTLAHNNVYKLVASECVEGVIIISGGLSNCSGTAVVQELCERYRPLPMCSLGLEVPGIPSIIAENRSAMRALVEHLVSDHGLQDFAFIGGPIENPDAKVRREVFEEVLLRYGLPIHDDLMVSGHFTPPGGEEAVYRLISTGWKIDAIICANDAMALGALEALRALGHHVPRDVILTGFDDVVQSRISSPAITTVRQPLDQMAALAVRLVFEQISGAEVPGLVDLPCEFVPRKSCGCGGFAIERSIQPPQEITPMPAEYVVSMLPRLVRLLERAVRVHRNVFADWAAPLVESLVLELGGEKEIFLSTLEELLDRTAIRNDIFEDFQAAVTLLRDELSYIVSPDLEALWHDARRLIAVANTRAHVRQRIELDIAYSRLLRSGEQLSTALDPAQLKRNLAEELPRMEIKNAFISQYVDSDLTRLVPFFCLRQGQVFDPSAEGFPATQLLPPGGDFDGQRRNWFVLPLTFEAEPLGVAVFEFGSGLTVYEMLREQIGTALNNIALHAEIVQKTTLHERSVQERLAATDRMQSLSVLAGGVAHDLNNALGPLVALPDVIIADLDALFRSHALDISAIKADLAVMKSASLRAARTIKDLLTLGRQGHTAKECLDVNVAVANWFNNESVPSSSKVRRRARVIMELASEPLTILASESHIVRAVSNLVRNAMEAIEGDGEIRVKTYRCVLREPLVGFEPIDNGDYVVVSVSDTGKGIAKQDMSHVFEPFFSKKRLDDGSGSGLGLAIVHGVVKEHNGFVNVESRPGEGACFALYFRNIEASIAPSENSTVAPVSSAKILVVDDDPVQLRTASRVLTRLGHVVTAIDSGVRARALLFGSAVRSDADGLSNSARSAPYDVVIMDMLLNEADDGLTVFEKMQAEFPMLRGIIASGHSPTDRTLLAVNRGLTWLAKPYTADALARSVQLALVSSPHRET